MGIRDQVEQMLQPSIDGLREAGVRELHLQPEEEGGGVAMAGDGFALLLQEDDAPRAPLAMLLSGASRTVQARALVEVAEPDQENEPATEREEQAHGDRDVEREPSTVSRAESIAAGDAAKRCGGVAARHKWDDEGLCARCGAARPAYGPVPVTTAEEAAAFKEGAPRAPRAEKRDHDAAEEAPPAGTRVLNDVQVINPGWCPVCAASITREETPNGRRWACNSERGCGWREWELAS